MKNEVKQLTIGGMVSALVAMLFLIDRFTGGFISLYYLLILPVILIIYSQFAGLKYTIITGFAIWLLIYLVTGSIPVTISALGYILLGWFWCYMERQNLKIWKKFLMSVVMIALIYVVQIRFFSAFFFASDESYDAMAINMMNQLVNIILTFFGASPIVFSDFAINVSLGIIYLFTAVLETFVIAMFASALKQRMLKLIQKHQYKG